MSNLKKLINKLNLDNNTVIYRKDFSNWDKSGVLFPDEVRKSLCVIKPDAVYHFNNTPFILFFDFKEKKNSDREKKAHKQVWCFDKAPAAFFIFDDEVIIYNAFHYQKNLDSLAKIDCKEYQSRFSFWNLHSGKAWKWLQKRSFLGKGKKDITKYRANQKLFENIRDARERITKKLASQLDDSGEFANILILRLIFIRYLIDRDIKLDENLIKGRDIEEKKFNFNHIIADENKLYLLFDYLKRRFNGNLFDTVKDPKIDKIQILKELSSIFSVDKNQPFLFDIFDFSVIPVEVISGIYESVIDPEIRNLESAVYTPSFLVDYILAQTVDISLKTRLECKIMDPACGSGIFLVKAYRKIVEKNKDKNDRISDKKLIELAKNNIFGIDKDINALHVAVFSIYIALLDYKDPPEIKEIKLPELIDKNLFNADFFENKSNYSHSFNNNRIFIEKKFDFIMGNPPWGNKKEESQSLYKEYAKDYDIPYSKEEISRTFIARVSDFGSKDTQYALVVTSRSLYNIDEEGFSKKGKERAIKFKDWFFTKFYADVILDLSPVRKLLFKGKNSPAMVLFYRDALGKNTENNIVDHFSIKQNIFLKYLNAMIIERQNRKRIRQKYFIKYDWMLKVALYGGTMDFHLLTSLFKNRISIRETIEIEQNKEMPAFFKGDGIEKSKPKKRPTFLVGMRIIENRQINRFYSVVPDIKLEPEDIKYQNGRKAELFDGCHILLKSQTEKETNPVISFTDTFPAVFRHDVFAITSKTDIDKLKFIYGILISSLYTYYIYMTSSSWGASTRPAIRFKEYLSFPLAKFDEEKKIIKLVDCIINHYKGHLSKGVKYNDIPAPSKYFQHIDNIVNKAYGINKAQQDLIDFVINISRFQFQENHVERLARPPRKKELEEYAKIFYEHFSRIYDDEICFQIDIFLIEYFVAMKFKTVKNSPKPDELINFRYDDNSKRDPEKVLFEIIAKTISIDELADRIFIQKYVKGFEEDFFYIIKPNDYQCWHRARARYDLAEFENAIMKAEIKTITAIQGDFSKQQPI